MLDGRISRGVVTALASLALLTLGCVAGIYPPGTTAPPKHASVKKPGPPPHAPAHGYRHKHHKHHKHGAELVFDSGLGVYVVVALEDVFYHVGHYYRWHDARWSRSDRSDGGWKVVVVSELPAGLKSYRGPAGKPKKAKGHKHKHKHKSGAASPARR